MLTTHDGYRAITKAHLEHVVLSLLKYKCLRTKFNIITAKKHTHVNINSPKCTLRYNQYCIIRHSYPTLVTMVTVLTDLRKSFDIQS